MVQLQKQIPLGYLLVYSALHFTTAQGMIKTADGKHRMNSIAVVEPNPCILTCRIPKSVGQNAAGLFWKRGKYEIAIDKQIFGQNLQVTFENRSGSWWSYNLTLLKTNRKNSGYYSCEVYRRERGLAFQVKWNLTIYSQMTSFEILPKNVRIAEEGLNVTAECRVHGGYPRPEIIWHRRTIDGSFQLIPEYQHKRQYGENHTSSEIMLTSVMDNDEWMCEARLMETAQIWNKTVTAKLIDETASQDCKIRTTDVTTQDIGTENFLWNVTEPSIIYSTTVESHMDLNSSLDTIQSIPTKCVASDLWTTIVAVILFLQLEIVIGILVGFYVGKHITFCHAANPHASLAVAV